MNKISLFLFDNKNFILLAFCGLVSLLFTANTPMSHDDWLYAFIYPGYERISSVHDVFVSQYNHYMSMNGRFVPHFIIQIFIGVIGKWSFNIANSLIFVSFLYLLSNLIGRTKEERFTIVSVTFFSLLLCVRGYCYSDFFLGLTTACNYLWPATFLLFYIKIYKKLFSERIKCPPVLLFFLGVFCGWTHEGLLLPFAVTLTLYSCLNYKRLTATHKIMTIGLFLGVALLVFSPGSYARAVSKGAISSGSNVYEYLLAIKNILSASSYIWIGIAVTIFFFVIKKKFAVKLLKERWYLVVAIMLSFLFAVFVKAINARTIFAMELFSLMLILLYVTYFEYRRIHCLIINFLSLVLICYIYPSLRQNYLNYLDIRSQLETTNNVIIGTSELRTNSYLDRFVLPVCTYGNARIFRGFDENWIENRNIAHYFGRSKVLFLPKNMIGDLHEHPEYFLEFNTGKGYPVFLKRIEGTENINDAKYILKKLGPKDVPLYIRPFKKFLKRYSIAEVNIDSVYEIEIQGKKYFAIRENNLNNQILKERLVGIKYNIE